MQTTRIIYKAKNYAVFSKSNLVKTNRKKGLIKYSENRVYYNATQHLSIKEGNKMSNTHVHKISTSKQFKRN